jgi:hypothetical protein
MMAWPQGNSDNRQLIAHSFVVRRCPGFLTTPMLLKNFLVVLATADMVPA